MYIFMVASNQKIPKTTFQNTTYFLVREIVSKTFFIRIQLASTDMKSCPLLFPKGVIHGSKMTSLQTAFEGTYLLTHG